jgi:capsular polysaccharide biosynthesis protein
MDTEPKLEIIAREAAKKEYSPLLKNSFRVIWKRLWLLELIVLVFIGAAVSLSLTRTPVYEASVTMVVGQEQGITKNPESVWGLQQLTQTMAEAVRSHRLAEEVIDRQQLRMTSEEFLRSKLSAEQVDATQFIEVRYRDSSPEEARQGANLIGEVFSDQISSANSGAANDVTVTVWERAAGPTVLANLGFAAFVAFGLASGVLLGVSLVFLLEHLDAGWQSAEEVARISRVPTLATVPETRVFRSSSEATGR